MEIADYIVAEDRELVSRTLGGDDTAFEYLFNRYRDAIHRLFVQRLGGTNDADDLLQNTFLKAWTNIAYFRAEARLSTWLYRIAYNTAVSHARRTRPKHCGIDERRLAALPDSEADRLEEWAEKQERLDALNRAVERLDPEERALVTLFYYEDRSVGECAAITELSEGNVKVRLHRIRKKLYVLVNDEMNGTE